MTAPLTYLSGRFGRTPRGGKTVVIVIVILAAVLFMAVVCGGILVALLLPAVQQARTAARRMQSTNNMKQIALALHYYHDTHGTLPPAYISDEDGNPMHSWRVLILPQIEEPFLYENYDFDKPWDHPDNMAVTQQMPRVYNSPLLDPSAVAAGMTPYVAISGQNTALGESEGRPLTQVTVGLSGTIAAIEDYSSPVFWAEPTDISPAQILANYQQIMDRHPWGTLAMMMDGAVVVVYRSTSPQALEGGFYVNDGRTFIP